MKNFEDMIKDMAVNEALKREAMEALNSDSLKITEEQYGEVVAFGKAHGYDFTEEDIHLSRATNREINDNELDMVTGGGCTCDSYEQCSSSQNTPWGGKGWCCLDYACMNAWNNCVISNDCKNLGQCNGNTY